MADGGSAQAANARGADLDGAWASFQATDALALQPDTLRLNRAVLAGDIRVAERARLGGGVPPKLPTTPPTAQERRRTPRRRHEDGQESAPLADLADEWGGLPPEAAARLAAAAETNAKRLRTAVGDATSCLPVPEPDASDTHVPASGMPREREGIVCVGQAVALSSVAAVVDETEEHDVFATARFDPDALGCLPSTAAAVAAAAAADAVALERRVADAGCPEAFPSLCAEEEALWRAEERACRQKGGVDDALRAILAPPKPLSPQPAPPSPAVPFAVNADRLAEAVSRHEKPSIPPPRLAQMRLREPRRRAPGTAVRHAPDPHRNEEASATCKNFVSAKGSALGIASGGGKVHQMLAAVARLSAPLRRTGALAPSTVDTKAATCDDENDDDDEDMLLGHAPAEATEVPSGLVNVLKQLHSDVEGLTLPPLVERNAIDPSAKRRAIDVAPPRIRRATESKASSNLQAGGSNARTRAPASLPAL